MPALHPGSGGTLWRRRDPEPSLQTLRKEESWPTDALVHSQKHAGGGGTHCILGTKRLSASGRVNTRRSDANPALVIAFNTRHLAVDIESVESPSTTGYSANRERVALLFASFRSGSS
ncbi:unnamed protein product [Gadus morhua 'NCC']